MKKQPENSAAVEPLQVFMAEPDLAIEKVGRAPKMAKQDLDDPADEKEREAAFNSDFTWQGKALNPYSVSRESLFLELRVGIGAPRLEKVLRDVNGFLADALRILYICSTGPADWRGLRGNPEAMQEAVDAWADENVPRGETAKATFLALDIYTAGQRNRHETAPAVGKAANSDDSGNL